MMTKVKRPLTMNMFVLFKRVCQFSFYLLFIGFSYESVEDFVAGKAVFQLFQGKVEHLKFPDITLCPRQERSLAYLKTKKLKEDFKLSSADIESFNIIVFLLKKAEKISSILEDYSFTLEESILENNFM